MANINLLPSDLVPKTSVIKIANLVLNLVYAGIALFLVLIVGVVAVFIFNSTKIKSLTTTKNNLETSIKTFQETEQQMVLAKDRIGKIISVWKTPSADKSLPLFAAFNDLFSLGVRIADAKISATTIEATMVTTNSQNVTKFLSTLISSDVLKSVLLKSFNYNPSIGYAVSFSGTIK
jgi:Tfp pilus assembly protein PilN